MQGRERRKPHTYVRTRIAIALAIATAGAVAAIGLVPGSLADTRIEGTVVDEFGPIEGATVRVQASEHTVTTSSDGRFSLAVGASAEELTPRELEVLGLVGKGLSNQKIADALVISPKTVKVHVSNILGKLNLADRTQAAIYAIKNNLVG